MPHAIVLLSAGHGATQGDRDERADQGRRHRRVRRGRQGRQAGPPDPHRVRLRQRHLFRTYGRGRFPRPQPARRRPGYARGMIEHIGSLCSGYGGLDRALSALLGLPFGWHAEIEKLTDPKTGKVTDNPVCELLSARYPGVPNHGDITAIDWTSLTRPRALAAGFPCQGVSAAGLQLADLDPRWL